MGESLRGRQPSFWVYDMVSHMKTTLNIDDEVMVALKSEAARQRRTMSELVETSLRAMLRQTKQAVSLPPVQTFAAGEYLVDIDDRNALYATLDEPDR